MATPTLSGTSTITISGGTISDRVSITDIVPVAGSRLSKLFGNSGYTPTAQTQQYIWNSAAFSDLTGGEVWLENSANNQALMFQAGGDCVIGDSRDAKPRSFDLHIGDSDLSNTSTAGAAILLIDTTDKIVCLEGSRFICTSHLIHANSALTTEPAARNPVLLSNSNASSIIRFTFRGGRAAADSVNYTLASLTVAKPNGTCLQYYTLTSAVTVRDVEYYDGLVDWRPTGSWAPPTRGVYVSDSWIKFLSGVSFSDAAPLIFGNELEEFKLVLDNSGEFTGAVWWQHGIHNTASSSGRVIYNNMSGVDWAAEVAAYNQNSTAKPIKIEHHITLQFSIIDQLGAAINGADLKFTCRDPLFSASTTVGGVTFPTDKVITATSDVDGLGQIGNDGGVLASDALCIEAFHKVGNNTGADVDGAYHSVASTRADHGSYTACKYSIYKWGKKIVFETAYTPVLAGNLGDGVQALGIIQLTDDTAVTAATIGAVTTGLQDLTYSQLYDRVTKYSHDNDLDEIVSQPAAAMDFGALDIVFDSAAGADVDLTGSVLTILCSGISADVTFTGIATTGDITITDTEDVDDITLTATSVFLDAAQDITGLTVNGDFRIDTGADSTLAFDNVNVTGDVLNDSGANTLTINATNSSMTTTEPGTGNGQVNLLNNVTVKVTTVTKLGVPITGTRVLVEETTSGSVTITRIGSVASVAHTAHGYSDGDQVAIRGNNEIEYRGVFTITNVTTNAYDFTVTGAPATPATGTITATRMILFGTTNGSGVLEDTAYNYVSDVSIQGTAKSSTSSPLYTLSAILGTITSTGLDTTVVLVSDE